MFFSDLNLIVTSSSQYVFTISARPSGTTIVVLTPSPDVILTFPKLSAADKTPVIVFLSIVLLLFVCSIESVSVCFIIEDISDFLLVNWTLRSFPFSIEVMPNRLMSSPSGASCFVNPIKLLKYDSSFNIHARLSKSPLPINSMLSFISSITSSKELNPCNGESTKLPNFIRNAITCSSRCCYE